MDISSTYIGSESEKSIVVGGIKGHVVERLEGELLVVYQAYKWKMIPKCTGRYTCKDHFTTSLKPIEMLEKAGIVKLSQSRHSESYNDGADLPTRSLKEFVFSMVGRKDRIAVVALDDENTTGIITYEKQVYDGNDNTVEHRYVHTLNAKSGFRRKLNAVGIKVSDTCINVYHQND